MFAYVSVTYKSLKFSNYDNLRIYNCKNTLANNWEQFKNLSGDFRVR
jgi:hypothetical protein